MKLRVVIEVDPASGGVQVQYPQNPADPNDRSAFYNIVADGIRAVAAQKPQGNLVMPVPANGKVIPLNRIAEKPNG